MKPNYLSVAAIVFLSLLNLGTQWNYHVAARQRDQALLAGQALLTTARQSTDELGRCVAQLNRTAADLAEATKTIVSGVRLTSRAPYPRVTWESVPNTTVSGVNIATLSDATSVILPAKSHAYGRITTDGVTTCYDDGDPIACVGAITAGAWKVPICDARDTHAVCR